MQGKVRTRLGGADAKYRLTVEELELFANQLETLPARVSGYQANLWIRTGINKKIL